MKLQVSQNCEIAGVLLAIRHRGKPVVHEVSVDLIFDSYFASLLKDGKVKIVALDEKEFLEKHEEFAKGLDKAVVEHVHSLFSEDEFSFNEEEEVDAEADGVDDESSKSVLPIGPPLNETDDSADLALKKEQVEAAKIELAELSEKKNLSNKDKKRVVELQKIVGE